MTVRRLLPWTVTLTVIWVLLNGQPHLANVLGGLAVSVLVLVAFPVAADPWTHSVHPLAVVRLAGFVAGSLVTSSIAVVATIVAPSPTRLRAGVVRVALPGATPLVTTLVANSITLTPGTLTLTVEIDDDGAVLHVHVLGLGEVEDFRASVQDLQRRTEAAFSPRPTTPVEAR